MPAELRTFYGMKTKTTIPVSLARETLKRLVAKAHPELAKHPDFNAIISHWLLTPSVQPPLLPDEIFKDTEHYSALLAKEVGLSE